MGQRERSKTTLDDRTVKAFKPPKTKANVTWWDIAEPAFGVRVSKIGRKSFVVGYRIDGRERRFTIGRYPSWSVSAARAEAIKIREMAREGIDYLEELRATEEQRVTLKGLTLRIALEEMIDDRDLREKSEKSYRGPVERYLGDWLDMPLCEITVAAVRARYKEIQTGTNLAERRDGGQFAGKDARGKGYRRLRGGEASAKAAMTGLRAIWKYAQWRHEDFDLGDAPTNRLPKGWNRIVVKETVIPEAKLSAFVEACRCYQNQTEGDLAQFLLFTGLRLSEGSALRWSEVDLERGILKLPPQRMKGKETLEIPLNGLATEVLRGRFKEATKKDAFVFPGRVLRNKVHHATITGRFKKYLDGRVGTHTSPHDWRRSFTTIALTEVPLHAVEVLTGHVSSGPVTLSTYYKPSMNDLRKACRKIEQNLRQSIGKDGEKVIFLPA